MEIVEHAAAGFTDKEIAHKLGVSMGSVNSYWVRCRKKLGTSSRASCVAIVLSGENGTNAPRRSTELRWLALLDASNQAIMIVSREYIVLEVNAKAREMFGRGQDFIGSRLPFGETRVERLDGTPMPIEEYPLVRCLDTAQPIFNEEMRIFGVNGNVVCVRVTVRPLTYDNNPPSEVLIVMDTIDDPRG